MATYHYHYCVIRQIAGGQASYTSGMYQTDTKIKFGQSYDVFIDSFKQVEEAMHEQGYTWVNPRRKLRSIDKMVQDLPRCVLEQMLAYLQRVNA